MCFRLKWQIKHYITCHLMAIFTYVPYSISLFLFTFIWISDRDLWCCLLYYKRNCCHQPFFIIVEVYITFRSSWFKNVAFFNQYLFSKCTHMHINGISLHIFCVMLANQLVATDMHIYTYNFYSTCITVFSYALPVACTLCILVSRGNMRYYLISFQSSLCVRPWTFCATFTCMSSSVFVVLKQYLSFSC